MGLWEPGSVSGLTVAMLQRVTSRAYADHVPRAYCDCGTEPGEPMAHAKWCRLANPSDMAPMLAPHAMPINEIAPMGSGAREGDSTFDRVSYGADHGQTFWYGGIEYALGRYYGKWQCRAMNDGGVTSDVRTGDIRTDIPEDTIARQLDANCGAHPNPYIARIELTYDTVGHRAGYGIRRDGSPVLFYN